MISLAWERAPREEEEKSDNMKQLENRTLDSKIELEIMDALDEIKAVNRRHETVDTEEVLKASAARREMGASIPVSRVRPVHLLSAVGSISESQSAHGNAAHAYSTTERSRSGMDTFHRQIR